MFPNVKVGDRVRLSRDTRATVGDQPLHMGKEGVVKALLVDDDLAPNEWYISVHFDGCSYYLCVPYSSLEPA